LGLFFPRAFGGRKDIRNDASMALYVEVSESVEVVLEWMAEPNEKNILVRCQKRYR